MPLTVIAGLPGSGRSRSIHTKILEAVRAERTVVLTLPTATDVVRARKSLASEAPVGCRVGTLDGLIEAEWALRGDGRSFIISEQAEILAGRALRSAGVLQEPGRGAVALLRSLAQRWAAAGREHAGAETGLPRRLVEALDAYFSILDRRGLIEPGEAAVLLAREAPPAQSIFALGFNTLRSAEEALFVSWAARGAAVTIELPWSDGVPATLPTEPLVRRLQAAGAEIVDLGGPKDGRPGELERVATHLFAGGPAGPGEGRVSLGMAAGDEEEARAIARSVQDAMAAGCPTDRIAVAFADPHRHEAWLRRAFADVGVEAGWDVRIPVSETPLGRAILRLWSFCRHGMAREDLGALLRSPFAGVPAARVDAADVAWRRKGVVRGRELLSAVREIRPLVDGCMRLVAEPLGAETGKKWKVLADALLSNAHPGMAPVPDSEGALDAAVHHAFCSAIDSAVCLTGEGLTPDEVIAVFSASAVDTAGAASGGGVTVASIERVGAGEYDHVVIGGLTASELPRRGSADRLEGDAVRRAIAALHVEVDPNEQPAAERLAFYLAATSACKTLCLMRQESDDEGRPLRESAFWDEFLDLYRTPGEPAPAGLSPVIETEPEAASTCRVPSPPTERGLVVDPVVLSELASAEAFSPGEIEAYLACPYRWYVERRLRPRSPDVALDVLAVGSAAHAALAQFYRRWAEVALRVTPENVEAALRMAADCVEAALAEAPAPTDLEQERLLATVGPSVEGLVSRDARFLPAFAPVHVEWSFGLAGDDPPVDLGGLLVKGRADRIDVGEQGLVVVDYKRTHASTLAQIQRDGLVQLQLYAAAASQRLGVPVAGGLYRSLAKGEDRGFVLDGVSGDFAARDVVDAAGIDEVISAAVEVSRAAVAGMRAGAIEPTPVKERCAWCGAAAFCPVAMRS